MCALMHVASSMVFTRPWYVCPILILLALFSRFILRPLGVA